MLHCYKDYKSYRNIFCLGILFGIYLLSPLFYLIENNPRKRHLIPSLNIREGLEDQMFPKSWHCQKGGGGLCPMLGFFGGFVHIRVYANTWQVGHIVPLLSCNCNTSFDIARPGQFYCCLIVTCAGGEGNTSDTQIQWRHPSTIMVMTFQHMKIGCGLKQQQIWLWNIQSMSWQFSRIGL